MTKIFESRWHQANHITITYLKRLFNDHFLVFLVIAFGAGVLGYRELLTDPRYMRLWQSPWLIAAVVLWLVVGLQFGALITYFKPADALFLMGSDQQLIKHYLPRAFAVSYGWAVVWQSAAIGLIVPILWQIWGVSSWRLALLWGIVLAYKGQLLLVARQRLFLTLQQSDHDWRRGIQAIIYR
ncbi:ABC transporter permease, partial [Leuconostoc lactis]|uniref:ABC transporter permease n=1 Tax=Leuconostoc lactis TaxID=1246 RepID=UPI002899E8B5